MLQKNAAGIDIATLCREQGITPGTLYNWRHKYGTTDVS
ncbi:MAG: transposase [Methylacidiphilales bacterium]|nr:transposase [Candidatus Methylacidiphilales bacterium]